MNLETNWTLIIAIIALLIASLGLVRDLFNVTLPPPPFRTVIRQLLQDRRTWFGVVFALLGISFLASYIQAQRLELIVQQQDAKLTSAQATQTAQMASLSELVGTREAQAAELTSLKATLTAQNISQDEICNQVKITAEPDEVTLTNPEGEYLPINYELLAPPSDGVKILLHAAQIFVNDGPNLIVIASGVHPTHFDKHVAAGQTIFVGDGVGIGRSELDKAKELNSTAITERKSFHVVSDKGVYCIRSVDVLVRISE